MARAALGGRAGSSDCWDALQRAGSRRMMPKGLYARALLIIIAPMVILQSVVAFVFMERHWNSVTQRLSAAVVQDIAALIDVYRGYPQDADNAQIRRIAQERLGLVVDFLPVDRNAAARAEAVLLAARPGAVGGIAQADRPAVLDRHGRPLGAGRNPHPARQRGDARVRAAQRGLCLEFGNLPALDGRHLAGAAHRRHPVPAQPDQADPAARRRRRELRQGPRRAEFPPARRARGAARGAGLHRDEDAHRARDRAAHRHARRRVARPAHRAHPLQARTGAARRQPGSRGDEEGRRRDGAHARGLSRLRARRHRRAVGADRHGGLPRGAEGRRRAQRPQGQRGVPRPADRHRAAGGVQALPRQSRVERRALRARRSRSPATAIIAG